MRPERSSASAARTAALSGPVSASTGVTASAPKPVLPSSNIISALLNWTSVAASICARCGGSSQFGPGVPWATMKALPARCSASTAAGSWRMLLTMKAVGSALLSGDGASRVVSSVCQAE